MIIEIFSIIYLYLISFHIFKTNIQEMAILGGGHGTKVGHVIHESGGVVIISERHAESLSALLIHKRSGFICKSYVMYVVRKHL